jgi:hypothetical protein
MAVALLALFMAMGGVGYSATGGTFILGQANTAGDQSSLSAKAAGKRTLKLTNTASAAGSSAAGFNVASGNAPFTVNSSEKVSNLNADELDGLDSGQLKTRGNGASGSFVNVNGCGSGSIVEYAVTLARPAKIFGAGVTTYGRSNPGPERPTIRVQLVDGSGAVLADTGRVAVDATTGNPSLSVAGLLFAGGTPFTAPTGTYTLRLWADNFGACTGFGQYQQPQLSHLVVN